MEVKTNMTPKEGIFMYLQCEGINMAYECEYLWLSPNSSWALVFCIDTNVCTISKVIDINKEQEICLPNR